MAMVEKNLFYIPDDKMAHKPRPSGPYDTMETAF